MSRGGCLVMCGYLAAAVALNWRLWAGLGTMSPAGDPGPADNDLMAWFMRYPADAIAHGHLAALVTTALNAPRGISLMWNASMPLPMVALAPVTLLAGPQTSLTILVTLGYAGSAAAMYWLLRRHGASVVAGALGGAVYGFSPGMVNAGIAHYQLQFAVLPPLIIEAVLRIVTGRGNALAAGAWLALLAAAQLFTGEEMLADAAIVCLVLAVTLAASRPRAVRARLSRTGLGLGTAAAVMLLICGYALWIQLHGPLTQHGSPWPIAKFGNSLGGFVDPQAGLVFHTASSAAYAASHGASSAEYVAYLGPALLILVAAVTVWYWRDLRVRAAGARHPCRALPRRLVERRRRRRRLRKGRAVRARVLASGRDRGRYLAGDSTRAGPHQDPRKTCHPGRGPARLAPAPVSASVPAGTPERPQIWPSPRSPQTRRSLAILRPATRSPRTPSTARYPARHSRSGDGAPSTRSRSSTTPWYSGVQRTIAATTGG